MDERYDPLTVEAKWHASGASGTVDPTSLTLFRQIAKDSDSERLFLCGLLPVPGLRVLESDAVGARTCAACDCRLERNPIKVSVGGKTVEVCCDDCAKRLKEAHSPSTASRKR